MELISKRINIKVPLPEHSEIFAKKGDLTDDLMLYEADNLNVLEKVKLDKRKKIHFHVKDGQYIKKGDVIFSEGLLGHKVMISDFNGIIELNEEECKILGQKIHVDRKVNFEDGKVWKVVPNHYIVLKVQTYRFPLAYYINDKTKISQFFFVKRREDITEFNLKKNLLENSFFINDNIYIDDLAKLIALGAKRIIVNGIFINNLKSFNKEIGKLDSFAVLYGFGEFVTSKYKFSDNNYDIIWGKNKLYFTTKPDVQDVVSYEHPYWGITGGVEGEDELTVELNTKGEKMKFYKKNLFYPRK